MGSATSRQPPRTWGRSFVLPLHLAFLLILLFGSDLARAHDAYPETGGEMVFNEQAAAQTISRSITNSRAIFSSGFEPGQPLPSITQYVISTIKSHTGTRSLVAAGTSTNQTRAFEVPLAGAPGKTFRISFWVSANSGAACQVVLRTPAGATNLLRVASVPQSWTNVSVTCSTDFLGNGALQFVALSSRGTPFGNLWIDDLTITENAVIAYPDYVQQFPAVTTDASGRLWMAVLERPLPRRVIRVYLVESGQPTLVATLEPNGLTGIAPPAIGPWGTGCIVAFPVEKADAWRIAYAFVDDQTRRSPDCKLIDNGGTANISPAIAVSGGCAWIAWESNADTQRSIYTCCVDQNTQGAIQQVSASGFNSYNPALVSLQNGSLFAAWDSVHTTNADIYGCWYRSGVWEPEQRITSDTRIERHPSLATWGDQVWMAWQAQSYTNLSINGLSEQRIAVARIDTGQLLAPTGLFTNVSDTATFLLRPRIAFDPAGRLWLSARQSISLTAGWRPVVWVYSGQAWSVPRILMAQQGRWQPVNLAWTSSNSWAAVQFDDLPVGWYQQNHPSDWNSGVTVLSLPASAPPLPLVTVPLMMPTNNFFLVKKQSFTSADFQRQQVTQAGQTLTLFFGDFHEHTDLSVCNRAVNPPGHDLFANERDIEKLDFMALTDHDYHFDRPQWDYNGEQTRCNHDEGRFVTFLGHEWTSATNAPAQPGGFARYGHHNLIFLDPYYPTFYNAYAGNISPADLWQQLGNAEYLCIPHELADWELKGHSNPPVDWNFVDELRQPLAEIFQHRGSYEYLGCPKWASGGAPFTGNYLQDAWAKQIIIGVIASPDHGGGYGKAGIWATELSRQSIFEAARARHTFGTSGAKMSLFFGAGDAMMGDKVSRTNDDPIAFHIIAKAWRPINDLVIFRNNQIVFRSNPGIKEVDLDWTDPTPPTNAFLWYYVRIQAVDTHLAWSSPIWFLK